uniref:Major histocompatibility complex class I UBA n=1 Tax=Sinocyclocheilus grahami TaxID=75366 RepID=A0A672RJM9_SINGR
MIISKLSIIISAIHSWKAYYTGTTGLSQFPEFVALNLIDDQLMGYFDSQTNRFKGQFKWMEDNLGKDYDDQQTNILQGAAATFKNNVKVAMDRFNQTQGVHAFQFMYGCELDDDGSKRGYLQYGYDGENFLRFDKNTLTFTNKWDSTRADWIKKYGRDTLERISVALIITA